MEPTYGPKTISATTTTTSPTAPLPLDLEVPDPPKLLSISPKLTSTNVNNNEESKTENVQQTNTQIELAESSIPIPQNIEIPEAAKQFKFGSQIMIIGLNSMPELNKKLGFIVGDYKKYSQRIPVRLISNTNPLTTYLLKLKNLQFVSPPIPGYEVEAYNSSLSSENDNQSSDDDDDSDIESNHSTTTSSSESSLSHTISIKTLNVNNHPQTEIDHDEDDDIIKSQQKLKKANESRAKYLEIMKEFNKPETIDLSPSVTSTKSLPIDCGLRWVCTAQFFFWFPSHDVNEFFVCCKWLGTEADYRGH